MSVIKKLHFLVVVAIFLFLITCKSRTEPITVDTILQISS